MDERAEANHMNATILAGHVVKWCATYNVPWARFHVAIGALKHPDAPNPYIETETMHVGLGKHCYEQCHYHADVSGSPLWGSTPFEYRRGSGNIIQTVEDALVRVLDTMPLRAL